MWILALRFFAWLTNKFVPLLLLGLMAVAGASLFIYARDRLEVEIDRSQRIESIVATQERLVALRLEAEERLEDHRARLEAAQASYRQAERLIANLQALRGFWRSLFQSREDAESERERLLWAERKREEIGWSVRDLASQVAAIEDTLEGLHARHAELERDKNDLEKAESEALSYVRKGWALVKGPFLVGAAMFLFGPSGWKVFCYYAWAPLIGLGKPIRLRSDVMAAPVAEASQVSKRLQVRPGEQAVVREKFLQASDDALRRRTRFVFDWKIPFSSAACGLIELTEMTNDSERDFSITFSTQEEPFTELALIDLPASASIVLRPSHLAGVIIRAGEPLRIERHWRIFSVHAWVTMQFRYFEFHGPCKLVVCGRRGVRTEFMTSPEGQPLLSRRTNQDSTIGFTPNLVYHSVRAETFWAYFRGMNPLFDDLFRGGSGAFLCQEISTRDGPFRVGRFWANFWQGFLKVFGL